METIFIIPKVSVQAWADAGLAAKPDYQNLAATAHDLSISIGEQMGAVAPDSWSELPDTVREPLTIFAQRIIEERLGMSEFHDIWFEQMVGLGYSYGPMDDDEALTSSQLVPYANLPPATRLMDACFEAGVLWAFKERYPLLFDLMPAQNDAWVKYQESKDVISLAGKAN
jgi:hypothetical protein